MADESLTPNLDAVQSTAEHFAALDLGSNSFHLIIARAENGSLQPIARYKEKIRLASGLKTHQLDEDAIERGLEALRNCERKLQGLSPSRVRIVATHALRDAENAPLFIAKANKILGFPVEVISGQEEARLIYRGVAETFGISGKRLVLDIGGGSTELAAGDTNHPTHRTSLAMGCISFTRQFFANGKLSQKKFKKAVVEARRLLDPVAKRYRKYGKRQVIGTSGTIKAIASWVSTRTSAQTVQKEHIDTCVSELLSFKTIQDVTIAGLEPERAEVIAGGLAILYALFEELAIDSLTFHDAALREGVLYELGEKILHHHDVRQRTIESLAKRYAVDTEQATRVRETALSLLEQTHPDWGLNAGDNRYLLGWAALLHEVGLDINFSNRQKHSGYILLHANMPGFNKEEQLIVATLVRFFRKKIRLDQMPELQSFDKRTLTRLLVLLRIAIIFNTDRQTELLYSEVTTSADGLLITLNQNAQENQVLSAEFDVERTYLSQIGFNLTVS